METENMESAGNLDNYDMDSAIAELSNLIREASDMYQQLKQVKFDYLIQTCEVYARIDYPSMVMESCRREIQQMVPKAQDIDKMDF